MKQHWFVILAMFFLLTGCFGSENFDTQNGADSLFGPKAEVLAEIVEGDFSYRLVSKKSVYTEGEKVEIYAELEYIGEKSEIKISHAASPFYFPMEEKIRDYAIGYYMQMPKVVTTLKKGEPLREKYKAGGLYSSSHSQEYIDFIDSVWEAFENGTLPWGAYQISGSAEFVPIYEEDREGENVQIEAEIGFFVSKNE